MNRITITWLTVFVLVQFQGRRGLGQGVPDFTIRFEQKAYVRINYTHNPSPLPLELSTWNVLPTNEHPYDNDTLAIGEGTRLLSIPVRTPQLADWQVGTSAYELYLMPADTIQVHIHFLSTGQVDTLIFTGHLAPYQAYLQRYAQVAKAWHHHSIGNSAPTLGVFAHQIDSLDQQEIRFLSNYMKSHSLPDWFVAQMRLTTRYRQASYRHNTVIYRRISRRETPNDVPSEFYGYLKQAPLPNPSAAHLTKYWDLVRDAVFLRSGRKSGQPFSFEEELIVARQLLPAKDIDFFKARYLTLLATLDPVQSLALLAKQEAMIRDKKLVEVIRTYALSKLNRLSVGKLVPSFFLPDQKDSLVSLKDYKGNLVVLCFWFPGCKPCVKEFPYENELVNRFADNSVKVVSIGTTSDRQTWQATIHRHDLRTIHLFANANWQKRLEQTYGIQGYPHYVLIDDQGRLLQNYAPRPSQGLEEVIRSYLSKTSSKK